jgi:hypothetical protein
MKKPQKILLAAFMLLTPSLLASPLSVSDEGYLSAGYVEQKYAENRTRVEAAERVLQEVQQAGRFVESLDELVRMQNIPLPIGIKKGDYTLVVEKLAYDEEGDKTYLYASCAFRLKEGGQLIAFDGQAVLEGENGLGTEGVLTLVAPVRCSLGSSAELIVREGTQLKFGCGGIEEFFAKMAWVSTSDKLVATDAAGNPTSKPLHFAFEVALSDFDFDSYLISLNVEQSFIITELKDVIFTLKGITIDRSDTETSAMARFPDSYFAGGEEDRRLWRGLSCSEATVVLPSFLKKPDEGGRITLTLQHALLDANGLTASVSAQGIGSSEALPPDQWGLSLNAFAFSFFKGELASFGFDGDMNLPPLGSNSLRPYQASLNPNTDEYEFRVNVAGKYDFPVWKSSLTLNELSTVSLQIREGEIYPEVNASGIISVNAPVGRDSTKKLTLPDITFENLHIYRESPYLEVGAIGLTGQLETPEVAGFQLAISDLRSFSDGGGGGLAFKAGVSLTDMFSGNAGLRLYGDYAHWRFNRVEIDKVHVEYKSKPFSLLGEVMFKNGDAVYGDGFRGEVKLDILEKFNVEAVAIFGKKDNFRYFLTDAFLELTPPMGITVPPALLFYGFGGGLYTKMQQTSKMQSVSDEVDMDFGKSLSGITYVPDKNVGLGLMATTKFALTGSPNAFNAKVGLELQFNSHGGLNFVQLRGEASLMNVPEAFGSLTDNMQAGLEKMEKSGVKQPAKSSKASLGEPEGKSNGFLTASILVEYDVLNSTFSADLNAYLNAGIIRGAGSNDRLGWSSARFSPNGWYIYAGTPSNRLGVKVLNMAELNGYFMLGMGIPPLPPPPANVLRTLSPAAQERLQRGSIENLTSGTGIAFGAGMTLGIDATLPPFYASIGAGLGTEFLLVDLRGKTCEGLSGTPGINGWYASAQAWAFVEADIGIGVTVFGKKRSFGILDIAAGTVLQGSGPNPLYFTGAVGGNFSVMGGLVSGNCTFDFEMGDKCKLVGGSPFGEDVIAELTPAAGSSDVNVFAAPQALFNIPVEREMTIDEEDGTKGTYKATLEEFSVKYADGSTVAGRQTKDSDSKVYLLKPTDPFESQKDAEVYVKVGFKKKVGSTWTAVKGDNGAAVYEEKRATFHTGDRPEEIMPEHVKYSYPVSRQYNFYPNEHKAGYLHVTENYAYLFTDGKPEGFRQKLRISELGGGVTEKDFTFTTNTAGGDIRFELNFSLDAVNFLKNKLYKLEIVNLPENATADIASNVTTISTAMETGGEVSVNTQQATGTLVQLNEKQIYELNFRTSSYGTFAEKMEALPTDAAVAVQEYPYAYLISSNTYDYAEPTELLDAAEIAATDSLQQLVVVEPLYGATAWFTDKVEPLIYNSNVLSVAGMANRQPPVKNVAYYATLGTPAALSDDQLSANSRPYVSPWGSIGYRAPYYVDQDFVALRNALANRSLAGLTIEQHAAVEQLLNADHIPLITVGDYPVKISYVLPGTARTVTTSVEKVVKLNEF